MIADGRGRAVAFTLAPGQAHELPMAPGLLACIIHEAEAAYFRQPVSFAA